MALPRRELISVRFTSRARVVVTLLATLVCAYPHACYAADNARFVTREWSVDSGLPHNLVNRVVQDPRGYLWVATGAGLARFNGIAFTEIPLPHRSASAVANIRDLVVRPDGTLLMLPATGGIMQYKDGVFSAHPASKDLADRTLLELFVEPDGVVWAGTAGAEVVRWENGRLQVFGQKEGILRRVNRISFATDRRGRTWVAAGDFLGTYTDGRLEPAPPALQGIGRSVIVAPARSGGLWIGTSDQLLKVDEDKTTVCARAEWPAKRSGIECMFEDRDGNLWVGTRRNGVYLYSAGKLVNVDFNPRAVFSIQQDTEGDMWIGTSSDGLCRLRPLAFTILDKSNGLPEDMSSGVCEDGAGAIWCANRGGGAIRWQDSVIQHVGAGTRAGRYASRVAPDTRGNVWLASEGGLYHVAIQKLDTIESVTPALHGIQLLLGTRNGDMWVQHGGGLGYFRDFVYQPLLKDGVPFAHRVNALAEDEKGNVWIATNDTRSLDTETQLWEYADGELRERNAAANWPAGPVHAMQFDHVGALWIATGAGLVLKEGDRLTRFTVADGLPDDLLMEVLIDDLGFVWCGSRRGFFRVASADLRAIAEGRAHKVVATVFGEDDGLRSAAALTGGQPRAWKARDGRLWFTTVRGVVGFDPAAAQGVAAAPPVYIENVSVDDADAPEGLSRLAVAPGAHRLSFRFAVLNYAAPEQVRLRHRLEGFEDGWSDTGPSRTATYSKLPPGQYRLRVMAANQSGVWNEHGASLQIVVAAAWWQTEWFIAFLVLITAGLVAWGARTLALRKMSRRLRELEKEHALERERSRIARNLHDELGGSLTQIGLLAERLKRQAGPGDLHRTLGQLAWRTRSLAGDLESIVWTVSPQNNSWDRLASFVAQFARRFFKDTGILCTVEGVEGIPALTLSPDAQHEVLALLKESLNNVLKHSHASSVAIRMQLVDQVFELQIVDNGIGFEPGLAEHSERNGLSNIRARGEALRGDAAVESQVGHGTCVKLRVPLVSSAVSTVV